MRRRRSMSSLAGAMMLVLAFSSSAIAAPNHRTVQILDNCGPSFNEFLGEGACSRPGGMSVDTFFKLFGIGGSPSWRFSPGQVKVASGGTVTAINRGGEFHSFTEVADFGGGCIDEINAALGLSAVPECAGGFGIIGATGVGPGGSLSTGPLSTGAHKFMCLIHPWQRTTVTVD